MANHDDDEPILQCEDEPVSPASRLLNAPNFNLHVVVVMGLKTSVTNIPFTGFKETLLKNPRFSSIMVMNGGKQGWRRTNVDIENHITMPDLDPDMDSPDEFVEDYASALSTSPMDLTKPLWELHILKVKTSDANSTAIFRIHHAMGDGASLIALLLACTRKSSDPESLPTIQTKKPSVVHEKENRRGTFSWRSLVLLWINMLMVMFNTFMGIGMFILTLLFIKDSETPVKGPDYGNDPLPRRFVHRIVSFEDVKLVKTATNACKEPVEQFLKIVIRKSYGDRSCLTVNDVILGVTQAGLSVYLNRRYGKCSANCPEDVQQSKYLPENIRLTGAVVFNNRQSEVVADVSGLNKKASVKGTWGNGFGYVMLPFTISLNADPLTYIYRAKSVIDRKKLSLESKCTFLVSQIILKFFGIEAATALNKRVLGQTTLLFSNVVGPQEEITFYGYPINYIAPSVAGVPQALTLHFQTYDNKLIISMAVDENVIPDPHQLCADFEKSLENMKDAVMYQHVL